MDREKAIKEMREKLPWLTEDTKRLVEALIPELRESEDERIRKELVEYLTVTRQSDFVSRPDRQRWIAYLEKQKEQEIPLMNGDADLYFDEWNQQNFNPTKRQCFEEGMRYATRLLTEDSPMLEEFKKGLEQVILWGREGYKVSPDGTTKSLTQDEIDEVLNKQKEQKPADDTAFEKWLDDWYQGSKELGEDVVMSESEFKNWSRGIRNMYQQKPAEWSEEDEKMMNLTKTQLRILQSHLSHTHSESMSDMEYSSQLLQIEKCVSWLDIRLKSLRPHWKPSEEQELNTCPHYSDGYGCDISPMKKCESCEHRPSWKPSEQKYDGNMDKECIKLCDILNSVPSIDTFESCCGHLKDRYSIWFFCNDIIAISRLGRCVERNYSDGKWELLVDTTDTHPTGVFWLRSKVSFKSYDEMEESVNELCINIQYWFNAKFDSYFSGNAKQDYHWKPSEEQIHAIIEALKYLPNNKDEWRILDTLADIFRKLM